MATPESSSSVGLWLQPNTASARALRWQEWALAFGVPVITDAPSGMVLREHDGQLQLFDVSQPQLSGVGVDFLSAASLYRKQHGGGGSEPIVKAIGKKGHADYHVVDATPGLGRDAFVMLSQGCRVTMVERSGVVAMLLADGLWRLQVSEPELAARFALKFGNSAMCLGAWDGEAVDAVYLDPMFPHRKKSALVKKEMRLFQQLLGSDEDADALLAPARALASRRVVVKRPNSAPELANQAPSMAIKSKKHRFDVYLSH